MLGGLGLNIKHYNNKTMVNRDYCLSQFLAFHYVFNDNIKFSEGLNRQKYVRIPNNAKTLVGNAEET